MKLPILLAVLCLINVVRCDEETAQSGHKDLHKNIGAQKKSETTFKEGMESFKKSMEMLKETMGKRQNKRGVLNIGKGTFNQGGFNSPDSDLDSGSSSDNSDSSSSGGGGGSEGGGGFVNIGQGTFSGGSFNGKRQVVPIDKGSLDPLPFNNDKRNDNAVKENQQAISEQNIHKTKRQLVNIGKGLFRDGQFNRPQQHPRPRPQPQPMPEQPEPEPEPEPEPPRPRPRPRPAPQQPAASGIVNIGQGTFSGGSFNGKRQVVVINEGEFDPSQFNRNKRNVR